MFVLAPLSSLTLRMQGYAVGPGRGETRRRGRSFDLLFLAWSLRIRTGLSAICSIRAKLSMIITEAGR